MENLNANQKPVRVKVDFPGIEHIMVLTPRHGTVEDLKRETERTFGRLLQQKGLSSRPIEHILKDKGGVLLPSWYPVEPLIDDGEEVIPEYTPLSYELEQSDEPTEYPKGCFRSHSGPPVPDLQSCLSGSGGKPSRNLSDSYIGKNLENGRKRKRKSIHIISHSDNEEMSSDQISSMQGTFEQNFQNALAYIHGRQVGLAETSQKQQVDMVDIGSIEQTQENSDGFDVYSPHTDDTLILSRSSSKTYGGDKDGSIGVADGLKSLNRDSRSEQQSYFTEASITTRELLNHDDDDSFHVVHSVTKEKEEIPLEADEMNDENSKEEFRISHKNLQKAKRKMKKGKSTEDLDENLSEEIVEGGKDKRDRNVTGSEDTLEMGSDAASKSKHIEMDHGGVMEDTHDDRGESEISCKRKRKKKKKWKDKDQDGNEHSQESLFSETSGIVTEAKESEVGSVCGINKKRIEKSKIVDDDGVEIQNESQEASESRNMPLKSSGKKSKRKRKNLEDAQKDDADSCTAQSVEDASVSSVTTKRKKRERVKKFLVENQDEKGYDEELLDGAFKKPKARLEGVLSTGNVVENQMSSVQTSKNRTLSAGLMNSKGKENMDIVGLINEKNGMQRCIDNEGVCFDDDTDNEISAIKSSIEKVCNDIIPDSDASESIIPAALEVAPKKKRYSKRNAIAKAMSNMGGSDLIQGEMNAKNVDKNEKVNGHKETDKQSKLDATERSGTTQRTEVQDGASLKNDSNRELIRSVSEDKKSIADQKSRKKNRKPNENAGSHEGTSLSQDKEIESTITRGTLSAKKDIQTGNSERNEANSGRQHKTSMDSEISSSISFSDCSALDVSKATKKSGKDRKDKSQAKTTKDADKPVQDVQDEATEKGNKEKIHKEKRKSGQKKTKRRTSRSSSVAASVTKVNAWLSQIPHESSASSEGVEHGSDAIEGTVDDVAQASFVVTSKKVTDLNGENKANYSIKETMDANGKTQHDKPPLKTIEKNQGCISQVKDNVDRAEGISKTNNTSTAANQEHSKCNGSQNSSNDVIKNPDTSAKNMPSIKEKKEKQKRMKTGLDGMFDDSKDDLRFDSLLDDGGSVISSMPVEVKKPNHSQPTYVQRSINGFLSNAERKRFQGKVAKKKERKK